VLLGWRWSVAWRMITSYAQAPAKQNHALERRISIVDQRKTEPFLKIAKDSV
jgi:hypothetical protein